MNFILLGEFNYKDKKRSAAEVQKVIFKSSNFLNRTLELDVPFRGNFHFSCLNLFDEKK